MFSYWAIFNGLLVVGLAFAAYPGVKSGKKTILAQVYDGTQHIASATKNNKGEIQPTDEEKEYINERIEIIIKEKLHYIIGFVMSAVGTLGSVWINDTSLSICEKRLELVLAIMMWWMVALVLRYFLERHLFKTITDNYNYEKEVLSNGDIFIQDDEVNMNNENKK